MMYFLSLTHIIAVLVFIVLPLFLLSKILKKAGLSRWYALIYIPVFCAVVYFTIGKTSSSQTGPNTDATGFTLSIAQFGGSSSQRRLFYIDPGGTLFKLTFSRRPEDYDPSHPNRPSTIDYDAPFESGGRHFF